MEKKDVHFINIYKRGVYSSILADFKTGKFKDMNLLLNDEEFIPYGFQRHKVSDSMGFGSGLFNDKLKDDVRVITFQEFIDSIIKKAMDTETRWVLIEITVDSDYGTHWQIEANYQFMTRKAEQQI